MEFKKVDIREKVKEVHRGMQESASVGKIALWNGRGKVQFRGQLELGTRTDNEKYTVILLLPDHSKGLKKYIYGGMVNIPDPRNKPADGSKPEKYYPEERIGSLFIYEDFKNPNEVYARMVMDDRTWYNIPLYQTSDQQLQENPRLPVLTGTVFHTFREGEEHSQQQIEKRSTVRRLVGAQNDPTYDETLDGPDKKSRVDLIIEYLNTLSSEEFNKVCNHFYLIKHQPKQFHIEDRIPEVPFDDEPDIEYVSPPTKEDYEYHSDEVEVEEEDQEDDWSTLDDTPTITKPKKRIAEVARDTQPTNRVQSLADRMKQIGSNLVEGIDEEELV